MITKRNNPSDIYQIVEKNLGIIVFEFIGTYFDYEYNGGFWEYLQRRKNNICRAHGLNPSNFEIK